MNVHAQSFLRFTQKNIILASCFFLLVVGIFLVPLLEVRDASLLMVLTLVLCCVCHHEIVR